MKKALLPLLLLLAAVSAKAQVAVGGGQLSASFETNTIYYIQDNSFSETPDDKFGSNNYLKLDYTYGKFSAGVQVEAYLPALYGYEIGQQTDPKKFYLASKYVQWQDDNFFVYVGDVYDQFGNGLIFRSYEDRALGINNSLEGVKAGYNFNKYFAVKAMYGRPRLYTDYAGSWVRGLDLSVSLADIFSWNSVLLQLEGSYVNRYEELDKNTYVDFSDYGLTSPSLDMWSGRLNFGWNGLSLRGEYARKSNDLETTSSTTTSKGEALYVEALYNYKNFSVSATYRALDHFGTLLSIYGNGTGNSLNYLPALTRQYTYMLANLNPYQVNTTGEHAVQADAFYTLRNSSNRHRYWNFHVNYSTAYTMDDAQTVSGDVEMMWSDINFDVERQWNRSLKTIFLFSRQQWSPDYGYEEELIGSNIFVADVTYKFNKKYSLRGELQYLLADDYEGNSSHYEGDWIAGLLEFSIAPKWSIFGSEMYNFDSETHYYNGGFSYTKNRTRVQISYGRNRAGYVCSGGVCRYTPAYTGLNLAFTTSF